MDPQPGAHDPVPVDLRDYVDFGEDLPSARRVFATELLALDLVCLEPGQFLGAREFVATDIAYTVLGGRAWVVTAEAEVTLEPLQALLLPAGVTHGVRNDGADPLILQAVASPPDEVPGVRHGGGRRPVRREPGRHAVRDRLRRILGGAD